jgi:hypothetical protein
MSTWYQASGFLTSPVDAQRWGFSAAPNMTRSPFTSPVDGEGPRATSGLYGLIPNNKTSYGYDITMKRDPIDEFDYGNLSYLPRSIENSNPLAGFQFTSC